MRPKWAPGYIALYLSGDHLPAVVSIVNVPAEPALEYQRCIAVVAITPIVRTTEAGTVVDIAHGQQFCAPYSALHDFGGLN